MAKCRQKSENYPHRLHANEVVLLVSIEAICRLVYVDAIPRLFSLCHSPFFTSDMKLCEPRAKRSNSGPPPAGKEPFKGKRIKLTLGGPRARAIVAAGIDEASPESTPAPPKPKPPLKSKPPFKPKAPLKPKAPPKPKVPPKPKAPPKSKVQPQQSKTFESNYYSPLVITEDSSDDWTDEDEKQRWQGQWRKENAMKAVDAEDDAEDDSEDDAEDDVEDLNVPSNSIVSKKSRKPRRKEPSRLSLRHCLRW